MDLKNKIALIIKLLDYLEIRKIDDFYDIQSMGYGWSRYNPTTNMFLNETKILTEVQVNFIIKDLIERSIKKKILEQEKHDALIEQNRIRTRALNELPIEIREFFTPRRFENESNFIDLHVMASHFGSSR